MRRAASPTASMEGATRAVSTFMRGSFQAIGNGKFEIGDGEAWLLFSAKHEFRDRCVDEVWLFYHAKRQVREEIGELVAPGEREDGVAVAPEDEGRGVDLRIAFELPASPEGGAVAVETAADSAGLREGFDV